MPSTIASHPTLSSWQLFSSRSSAAARLVGSMRSRGPGMSPSGDRAWSYVGPPSLKCATVSRVGPPPGGGHWMVAVEYEAGDEGHSDERRHVPTPPHVWLRGRL